MCTYLKNSFSLSLIFFQTLLPPPTCLDGSLAFPWKYHFLRNSFQFWPLLQSLSNFKGKEEKNSKLFVPYCPFQILEPLQSFNKLCSLSYSEVGQVTLMTPFPESVLRTLMKVHQAICSDFLDTAIWTKKRHLTQLTAVRFPLSQEFGIGICLA